MEFVPLKIFSGLSVEALYTAHMKDYTRDFHFLGESHDFWELDCVMRGCCGITSGENVYECGPYELVIHKPKAFHTAWAVNVEDLTILTVSFATLGSDHFLPAGKFVLNEKERLCADLLAERIPRIFTAEELPDAQKLHIQKGSTLEDVQTFRTILELLLLLLGERNAEAAQPAKGQDSSRFTAIVRYLNEHVCDQVTTEDLCEHFDISRGTVKALFRRYTGSGVMAYYRHLRIKHAVTLMDMGLSMAEISREMNFSTQNYFSAFFKRETGVAPREYQKSRSVQDR